MTPEQDWQKAQEIAGLVERGTFLRVVNYHATLHADEERFRQEIRAFRECYHPVSVKDLDAWCETGKWPYDKPGLIPAVFEGWRNGYDVMAKVLNEEGFTGWFYLPAFFPDIPVEEQVAYCKPHGLRLFGQEEYDDPRCAMTWDEIREIAKNHVIACHTGNHARLDESLDPEILKKEIVDSRRRLEEMTGAEVTVFCWRGGDEYRRSVFAHSYLKEAGYRYLVSNLKIEKIA